MVSSAQCAEARLHMQRRQKKTYPLHQLGVACSHDSGDCGGWGRPTPVQVHRTCPLPITCLLMTVHSTPTQRRRCSKRWTASQESVTTLVSPSAPKRLNSCTSQHLVSPTKNHTSRVTASAEIFCQREVMSNFPRPNFVQILVSYFNFCL